MTAGYSKRSLVDKLGLKPGMRAAILNAPEGYAGTLERLPEGLVLKTECSEPCDFIQFFADSTALLEAEFPRLKAALASSGALWISWRKGTSNTAVDPSLNEHAVREIGLRNGLVDVKVIAIDAVWSGLKFVYRLKDRP